MRQSTWYVLHPATVWSSFLTRNMSTKIVVLRQAQYSQLQHGPYEWLNTVRPRTTAKIGETLSTHFQNMLFIAPNLLTFSKSSKKYEMSILDKSRHSSIESNCPCQKPGKFLYRTAPVQKHEKLKKEVNRILAMKITEPTRTQLDS